MLHPWIRLRAWKAHRGRHGVRLAPSWRVPDDDLCLTGALRMEFGPGGSNIVEAGPGDFVYVPKGVVYREGNGSAEPANIVVVRAGSGSVHDQRRRAGASLNS